MTLKNKWHFLPLTLFWHLRITDEKRISWEVRIETEEDLAIDCQRAILVLSNVYQKWLDLQKEGEFFKAGPLKTAENNGDDPLGEWIAVKPSLDKHNFPGIIIKFLPAGGRAKTFTQELRLEEQCLPLGGFQIHDQDGPINYLPGNYKFFLAEINIVEPEYFNASVRLLRVRHQEPGSFVQARNHPKVLLLNLPWRKGKRWGVRAGSRWPHLKDDAEEGHYLSFPFFLAQATNLLKLHGFPASFLDCIAEKITARELAKWMINISPGLIVVETSTPSLNYDLALLKRTANGKFKICLCGPDANIARAEFLEQYTFIDFVLTGEYEYNLLGLVKNLSREQDADLKHVHGLLYRLAGKVEKNTPGPLVRLDELPWPAREGLAMEKYLDTPGGIPQPSVQMLASRGCPFGCKFCLWPQVMYQGNKYRTRDVNDLIDEMEYLVKSKGFRSVYFDDDTFNIGKKRMFEICGEIKKRGLEKTPWAIMARADLMDEEMILEMKGSGLAAIKYGVESASQELLDNCDKGMDLKKTEKMVLFTQGAGIKTHLTFTFGLPGETKETINKTIQYALKLKPFSVQFSITTPFPGTAYYDQLDKSGLIINKNWDDYDGNFKSVIKLQGLSAEELESARNKAYAAWNKSISDNTSLKEYYRKLKRAQKEKGIFFLILKALNHIRGRRATALFRKIKDNYLDMLGIMHGRRAFKGPRTIQIDLTDYCNNDCLACWCNSPLLSQERLNKPKNTLPAKLVKDLIYETWQMGLEEIYFSGGGEPFMHPDILEILEFAKSLGISCVVNTNFTLLNESIINRLIDMNLDHLTVSVWAGDAKMYKALHPNKTEDDFYRIQNLLQFLNSKKTVFPDIKIYNVICNINYRQIKKMLEFARLTHSEFVEFTVVDTIPKATDQLILTGEQRKCILEQFREAGSEFKACNSNHHPQIINLEHFLRRIDNQDAENAEYDSRFIDTMPCYIGWLFSRIMPDGDVNSCLKSHRFPIGNIHQTSFRKIWNSEKQAFFREKTLQGNKNDVFFTLIGNDSDCKIGCYKSCDDIGRNLGMHAKLQLLSSSEKLILKILAKSGLGNLISHKPKRIIDD